MKHASTISATSWNCDVIDAAQLPGDQSAFLYRCPRCGGPLSVRGWLLAGDCFNCGMSIELSLAVLSDSIPQRTQAVSEDPAPAPASAPSHLISRRIPTAPSQSLTKKKKRHKTISSNAIKPAGFVLDDLPAWFASLFVHVILLMLLAVIVARGREFKYVPRVMLVATFSDRNSDGSPQHTAAADDAIIAKLAGQEQTQSPDDQQTPQQDASSPNPKPSMDAIPTTLEEAVAMLSLETTDTDENVPEMLEPMANAPAPIVIDGGQQMFEGRDPKIRTMVLRREGGSQKTEAAVAKGLFWLAGHQDEQGGWDLAEFHNTHSCNGQCNGQGIAQCPVAATAMGLLPFLGAGQTTNSGIYKDVVRKGVDRLLSLQSPNGDLRDRGRGRMYSHAQGTIALCEAHAMHPENAIADAAERAVRFLEKTQHQGGGWRYEPNTPGDLSVTGWMVMALQSARMAGIAVSPESLDRATVFLDSVATTSDGSEYAYLPEGDSTPAMTAEGLLCRQYLGWQANEPGLERGIDQLLTQSLPNKRHTDIYYWYYGTQVLHHVGGPPWEQWNEAMHPILAGSQEKKGHKAGSWDPRGGGEANAGGRIYMTCLAICTLEVYYRHLPLYRKEANSSEKK